MIQAYYCIFAQFRYAMFRLLDISGIIFTRYKGEHNMKELRINEMKMVSGAGCDLSDPSTHHTEGHYEINFNNDHIKLHYQSSHSVTSCSSSSSSTVNGTTHFTYTSSTTTVDNSFCSITTVTN